MLETAPDFRLSASAYQVLWEQLRLAEMPAVLHVQPRGGEQRTEVVNAAWDELHRAGLVRGGGVRPELVDALTLLARPARAVHARLWLEQEVRALAAASGRAAVLAVLTGDELRLTPIEPGGLARAVVELLPARAAATGAAPEFAEGTELSGQFGATAIDRLGRRDWSEDVIGCHDTPAGRYLVEERIDAKGTPVTTLTPADATQLVSRIERLLGDLG